MNVNAANSFAAQTTLWATGMKIGENNALPYGSANENLLFSDWDTHASTLDLNGHTLTLNALTSQSTGGFFVQSIGPNLTRKFFW